MSNDDLNISLLENNNQMNKIRNFTIINELGKGAYATVYKVLSEDDGKVYVLKKINLKNHKTKIEEDNILKKIDHKHIIKYYDSFLEKDDLCIILEYAEGGDLYSLMKSYRRKKTFISEDKIWNYTYQILLGLDYLHSNNIIHRDIKLLNIFLKDNIIKIGDLGVSKIVEEKFDLDYRVGTPLYLAPEFIKQIAYDFKVDIWSLGCSLFHLLTFEPPFYEEHINLLENKILQEEPYRIPSYYSDTLSDFIFLMLSKNPHVRPSTKECIALIPEKFKVNNLFIFIEKL
jgi:NIMA (never in mitosis gene a)-related kinase